MTAIIARETGLFPISIPTSLALEGFFQKHPDQPKMPPGFKTITEIWINVRTMVRNFFSSMTGENQRIAPLEQCLILLIEEFAVINRIPTNEFNHLVKFRFYFNDLENLNWEFPKAERKLPKTDKQLFLHQAELMLLQSLLEVAAEHKLPIKRIRSKPKASQTNVALLTHHPHELLWRFEFGSLFLLESHTGKLKPYSQWFTKLHNVEEADRIPFNKLTLQIFGDNALFNSQPKIIRDEVKQIASVRRWTAVTTLDKIKADIKQYGGEKLRTLVFSLS